MQISVTIIPLFDLSGVTKIPRCKAGSYLYVIKTYPIHGCHFKCFVSIYPAFLLVLEIYLMQHLFPCKGEKTVGWHTSMS